jgi:DNA polymerase-3 subunit gamma/tau
MEVMGDTLIAMRDAPDPRVLLDVALVRLCRPEVDVSPAAMLERLERLERLVSALGSSSAAAHPSAGPPSGVPPSTAQASTGAQALPPVTPVVDRIPIPPGAASEARQALGATRRPGAPGASGARRPASSPAPPPVDPSRPAPPEPGAAARPATVEPAPPVAPLEPEAAATTHADGGDFPTRDALTLAWGDHILATLPRRAAVRFQVGRFVAADDGVAVFALPNAVHRDRCEEVRGVAEEALSAHFGRRVPLRLAVEGTAPSPGAEAAPPPDDEVDTNDLRDAPPGELASPLDHVMRTFEGAQVVEE